MLRNDASAKLACEREGSNGFCSMVGGQVISVA